MLSKFSIYAFADEASAELDGQIDAMRANRLDGLEIRGVDGENISDISCDKAKLIKARLDDAGLHVWSIGSPSGKIGINDSFGEHLDSFKHMLELAAILEADMFRLFSFYIPKGADPTVYRDEVMLRLNEFCNAAEGSGVTLCHENEKGIYGDNADRCLDILKSVPRLTGIFDPANFIQCGQNVPEAWEMLKHYIKYMHIKDALEDGKVVPAGKGIGNLEAILADFKSLGGTSLTLEPHLHVFDSLATLERDGEKTMIDSYTYNSKREAFDAAVSALRSII